MIPASCQWSRLSYSWGRKGDNYAPGLPIPGGERGRIILQVIYSWERRGGLLSRSSIPGGRRGMITHQVFLFLREREGRLGSWFSYSWGRKKEENLEKVFLFLGERGGRLRMLQDQAFHAEWRAKLLCFLSEIHLWHCEEAAFAPYPITRFYTFMTLQ